MGRVFSGRVRSVTTRPGTAGAWTRVQGGPSWAPPLTG